MSIAILISTEEEQKPFSFDLACSDKVTGDDAADLYDMLDNLQDSTW